MGDGVTNENSGEARNLVQAETVSGGIHYYSAGPEVKAPAQLPAEPFIFVDREDDKARLDALLAGERDGQHAACALISGLGGTGKTALACHWLYRVRTRFEHGQIYFDCHTRSAVGVAELLEHCLRALDVPGDQMPTTLEGMEAELRTRTSGRRLVLWFDNVSDPQEVLRLRPASAESLLLLTSRHSAEELALDGVESVRLKKLDLDSALRLLADTCGRQRVDAEPEAARRIVELCDGLPIALRIVAGRLCKRPWRLSRVADELADEGQRLDRLVENGYPVVRVALDLAIDGLDTPQRQLYGLLGIVPCPTFSAAAVAAMAGMTEADAEELLHQLHDMHLLERDDQDHFRFHDLVRLHAQRLRPVDADDALRRLVTWYRRQGAFADRAVMEPSRLRVGRDDGLVTDKNPFDHESALHWLERERINILSVAEESAKRDWHHVVISLCDSPLWTLHNQHKHYRDTLASLKLAIAAAGAEGDLVAEARMRSLRTRLLMEQHEFDAAHAEGQRACDTAWRSGNRRILASAQEFHGRVYLEQGSWGQAASLFEQALSINAELGRPRGMALQEHFLGQALDGKGEHEKALRYLEKALERFADFPDDRRTPDRIRVSMGAALRNLGRHDEAIESLSTAVAGFRSRQVSFDLAKPLEMLADSLDARGDPAAAQEHRREALQIYEQARHPAAQRLRRIME